MSKTKKDPIWDKSTLNEINRLVSHNFNDKDRIDEFMRSANPACGYLSPITMIRIGRLDKLLKVLENLFEGNNP